MRHLHLDPADPSRIEPGKRPRSNESPLIVLKSGEPFMAWGTPGNDGIWQRLPQVIVNLMRRFRSRERYRDRPRPRFRLGGAIRANTDTLWAVSRKRAIFSCNSENFPI